MITELDPNIRWAKKTLRMTFMQWGYKVTHDASVGGNCSAMSNLDAALSNLYDKLPPDSWGVPYLVLEDSNGDSLQNGDDERRAEDWLMDMLVSAELVNIEPETPKGAAA